MFLRRLDSSLTNSKRNYFCPKIEVKYYITPLHYVHSLSNRLECWSHDSPFVQAQHLRLASVRHPGRPRFSAEGLVKNTPAYF
jgi:hypothetical protein